MTINNSDNSTDLVLKRFNEAERSLQRALKNLEEVIFIKLEELDAEIVSSKSNNLVTDSNKQISSASSLNAEINNLQQSLAELGLENENLSQSNKILAEKIHDFKQHLPKIVAEIESDLVKITNLFEKDEDQSEV
jgi:predicted nuclease with TOPRIM domain